MSDEQPKDATSEALTVSAHDAAINRWCATFGLDSESPKMRGMVHEAFRLRGLCRGRFRDLQWSAHRNSIAMRTILSALIAGVPPTNVRAACLDASSFTNFEHRMWDAKEAT